MAESKLKSVLQRTDKVRQATAVAIFFHIIGLAGLLWGDLAFFNNATVFNLILMFGLLIYSEGKPDKNWWKYMLLCYFTGMAVEWIGVHTGWLFGNYSYGNILGPKWSAVPLIIGLNWFLVMYGSAMLMNHLNSKITWPPTTAAWLKHLLIALDAACVAVLFDWVMEPVAVQLGYWHLSGNGAIPLFNYACWLGISWLLQVAFFYIPVKNTNLFAVHLLLIQAMFFLILRTFL